MNTRWAPKDPNEVKDYGFNWTQLLAGDTILTSEWTIVNGAGLVKYSDSIVDNGTGTEIWLSGGTDKTLVTIVNHIKTVGGRDLERTRYLPVNQL